MDNANIFDNNASNNYYAIYLNSSSNNNLTNNTANLNSIYGIWLSSSSNNTIYNNYFNNTNNAYDDGYNVWNTTKTAGTNIIGGSYLGGNYWSNYAGEDTDGDRLGDTLTPYNSGNITNGGDYHPLMTVDTTAPSITIISPENTTYSNASILLNVTTNQTANVTYSLNGDTNLSLYNLTTSGNTTIIGTEGANNITIYANDSVGNLNFSRVNFTIDTKSPASITNLTASAYAQTYINWTWTDPDDSDFSNISVYLNGIFQANVTDGTQYFYASSLAAGTGYTISTRTVDILGNTNTNWENNTQTTSSYPPPAINIATPWA